MTRKNGKGIELALETAGELPGLRADERKLKQILVNLLSNAIKFTDAGGKVTLRAWCRVDRATCTGGRSQTLARGREQ